MFASYDQKCYNFGAKLTLNDPQVRFDLREENNETTTVVLCYLPLDSSSLLLLLESNVFQLQRAGNEADLATLFH